ncbi:hypothetical protein YDYSG_64900 [Paenibacillus tyrfis]|uniref:hypothetical protein n=1 Tax=Paenibacillus tyrfis TaxID=1501230 RepID=UPI00248FB86B|nr:hypothetical protein [Paenibacillus tyrfis]GLI10457.1 hypothetical protein YDYSG_64900 [Paenibacillus tyrfis]
MSSTPILFQFDSQNAAALAQNMLEELGYRVSPHTNLKQPTLHVIVDRHDLTSALEIVQAYGGRLIEAEGSLSETAAFAMAYDPDSLIPIPAHFVNDDWTESEPAVSASDYVNRSSGAYNDEDVPFDPSGDNYNGFDAGLRF